MGGGGGEWVVVVVGVTRASGVGGWVMRVLAREWWHVRGGDTKAAHPLPEALRTLDCGRSDTWYDSSASSAGSRRTRQEAPVWQTSKSGKPSLHARTN